jgi:hypothetical protein
MNTISAIKILRNIATDNIDTIEYALKCDWKKHPEIEDILQRMYTNKITMETRNGYIDLCIKLLRPEITSITIKRRDFVFNGYADYGKQVVCTNIVLKKMSSIHISNLKR